MLSIIEKIFLAFEVRKVTGIENLPKTNFIILFNDSPKSHLLSYLEKYTKKPVHIFISQEHYAKHAKYFDRKEHIPYSKKRTAFDLARLYLRNNHIVAVFKEPREISKLVFHLKLPLVNVAIKNSSITVSKPVYFDEKSIEKISRKIMKNF